MNRVEQTLAEMTKAQRDMPVTQGELVRTLAKVLDHMKALKQRADAFEQRIKQLESRR
jgi:hypothetical protein